MLRGFQATSTRGGTLELLLGDISKGYVIKSIDGLDPVKANIVSSSSANEDGEQYQAARREKRNIIIKIGLDGDFVVGGVRKLRRDLYAQFFPKSETALRFLSDDEGPLDISGRVESFEAPLFTEEPEATISILCFNPDFVDPTNVIETGFSNWTTPTRQSIEYDGDVETGFLLRINIDRAVTSVGIYSTPLDGVDRKMDITGSFINGDTLEISTIAGEKRVYLIRGGVASSVLYGLSSFSDWINLYPGVNQFRVAIEGAAIPYSLIYTTKYGGL